ncbi:MAG TPA: HD-GYP domain-containing protein [Chloroflexota bacterium]|nr:HD-GYP domain-containing protein [Chloroflexota bacterium]
MTTLRRQWPQPILASIALAAALGSMAASWLISGSAAVHSDPLGYGTLGGLLALALVVCYPITVHVRQNTKTQITTVLVYLLVVLVPVPAACALVFLSICLGELRVRRERGTYLTDIATQVGRGTVCALGASLVAHVGAPGTTAREAGIVAAAGVLWLGDALTLPALMYPITGERLLTVIRGFVREAAAFEAALYLLGILGVEAALHAMWSLALLVLPIALVYVAGKRNKEMQVSTATLLEHMADAVDLRDPYTGGHSRRVTEYVRAILQEMALHGPDVELIITAARVHDIGKIGIPDAILLKDGQLNGDERAIMDSHPEKGDEFLRRHSDFSRGAAIVLHHHERWDGEGYPHRLRGTEIPFGARVIAVADSFDAMTSDRPYRRGMSPDRAAAILREGRGRQWDGAVVDAFLRTIADRLAVTAPPQLSVVSSRDEVDVSPTAALA